MEDVAGERRDRENKVKGFGESKHADCETDFEIGSSGYN